MGTRICDTTRVQEIVALHGEIDQALRQTMGKAIRIGELLSEQKEILPHGQFTPWVKENLPFTDRTARNYMRVYQHRELLKTENVSVLGDAYRLLAAPHGSCQESGQGETSKAESPFGELPPGGTVLVGTSGKNWIVWIAPDVCPGYYYVTAWYTDEGGTSMEGTKRAMSADGIPYILKLMRLPSDLAWKREPSEPWEYNERFFRDKDHYIREALLGGKPIPNEAI